MLFFKKIKINSVADNNHGRWWRKFFKLSGPTSQRHFVVQFCNYLKGAVDQAHHRENGIPGVDDYLTVRRQDIGAYPCFPLLEAAFELPDEVYYHPVMVELSRLAVDMIIFDNVCYSLPPECIHGI